MPLYSNIERSTRGSLRSKLVACYNPTLEFLNPAYVASERRRHSEIPVYASHGGSQGIRRDISACFIEFLARAGSCRQRRQWSTMTTYSKLNKRRVNSLFKRPIDSRSVFGSRQMHTEPLEAHDEHYRWTKDELLALVDTYDHDYNNTDDWASERTKRQQSEPLQEPMIIVSDKAEDAKRPYKNYIWPLQRDGQKAMERLKGKLRDWQTSDPATIFELYRSLPAPRIPYLDADTRHQMLNHLGVVERKDNQSMFRYLSVVDDMHAHHIPLLNVEWNMVMSFVGRYVKQTTILELEAGLRVLREMELSKPAEGTNATFNILFDIATKAGKFKMADRIYEEMQVRGFAFNRYHHVSLIHHYGLQGDGDGARKAYQSLVEAGEIVDTVVLNCFISAMIRSGEPQAAEYVFERMKQMHASRRHSVVPMKSFRERRQRDRYLLSAAELSKSNPKLRDYHQATARIAPDKDTYRILVRYFAEETGDLLKASLLLEEMQTFDIPLDGTFFLYIFSGFAEHGGIRYSDWSPTRLESTFTALINATDQKNDEVFLGTWLVISVLRAFRQCNGKSRTLEVWHLLQEKWEVDAKGEAFVESQIALLTSDDYRPWSRKRYRDSTSHNGRK